MAVNKEEASVNKEEDEKTLTDSEEDNEQEQERKKIEAKVQKENVAFILDFIRSNRKIISKKDDHEFFKDFKKNNDIFDGLKADHFRPGNYDFKNDEDSEDGVQQITRLSQYFTKKKKTATIKIKGILKKK